MGVFRPLTNSDPGRVQVQLDAMVAFAAHMHDVALHRAFTAPDAAMQRAAIEEWIYWQHVSGLNADAREQEVLP